MVQLIAIGCTFVGIVIVWLKVANRKKSDPRKVKFSPPFLIRLINFLTPIAELFGFPSLNRKSIVSKQLRGSSMKELEADPSWVEPMDRLLSELNDPKNKVTLFGKLVFSTTMNHTLKVRLQVKELLQKRPEIASVNFRPVFIVGMFRTGTTLLHNLMAQDPACRAPHGWELLCPVPPPKKETYKTDPRIATAKWQFKFLSESLHSIHEIAPDGPEEDIWLMGACFWFIGLCGLDMQKYYSWVYSADNKREMYQYLKLLLQILTVDYPPQSHWIFKSPGHVVGENLQFLYETFPNATFIMTHRKLSSVVASSCSLFRSSASTMVEDYSPELMGKNVLDMLATGIEKSIKFRESVNGKNFIDVQYDEFVKNPIETVKAIYASAGLEYSQEFEDNMKVYMKEHPQGKHGRHSYSLEDYGLSEDKVLQAFDYYHKNYVTSKI